MCTVTVLHRQHTLLITMNRDEQRVRVAEQPPSLWVGSDLTAPRDGGTNGTWIGVAARGHWACILNSYASYTPAGTPPSRGEIIPALLANDAPLATLQALPVTVYRPFRILLGDTKSWELWHWNGERLHREAQSDGHDFMISSSSWNKDEVLATRREAFAAWQAQGSRFDERGIATIHRWQEAGQERASILMARPESHTTSITQIALTARAAPAMHYWPASELTPLSLKAA